MLLQERGKRVEAETWYRRGADTGDSKAIYNLAVLLNTEAS